MTSPINKMIDNACKCLKCGKSMKECLESKTCTLKCHCGWMYRINKKCANPIHNKLPKLYKRIPIKKQTEADQVRQEGRD